MELTWGNIKQWRAAPLESAERDLKTARDDLLRLSDELAEMGVPKNWGGSAATASRQALGRVSDNIEWLVAEVSGAHRAVMDAADAVDGVVRGVEAVTNYARLHNLSVSADGTVTDDEPGMCYASEHDAKLATQERQGIVDECVSRIEEALRKAADLDGDLLLVLNSIIAGTFGDGGATTLAEASAHGDREGAGSLLRPPVGGPADSTAWWASMSPEEQRRIITEHPEWIGNLDGIDFASRDAANRVRLAAYLEHPETLTDEQRGALATLSKYARTDANGDGIPDFSILGLDLSQDRAQAIIGNGPTDTADHVAVFTPGLTSTVAGMGSYVNELDQLRTRSADDIFRSMSPEEIARHGGPDAAREAAREKVATVVWLDYQAPQFDTVLSSNSVAAPYAAKDGGENLADFLRGVNTSRATDPHLTGLGHSYGSTTTGFALQHSGVGVDDAIFFGSPGLGTSDLGDLQVPEQHSYYAEAKWDLVGDLGRFGTDPSALDGMRHLETGAKTIDGTDYAGITQHSNYLHDHTTSQYNMAKVVSGHADQAVQGRNIGMGDPLGTWFK
jgi:hypothetical protein